MKQFKELRKELNEKANDGVYHDTYSSALEHAYKKTADKGYEFHDEEHHKGTSHVDPKPEVGKTKSLHFPLTKNGKETKEHLHVQVYNRGNDVKSKYEVNHYIS